jgi:membrane-associated phospholipid phosphatase
MLSALMDLSIRIIAFLQLQFAWLTPVMQFFTFLGNAEFYLLIMPFLVWSLDYALGMRLGVMLMLSGTLNGYLKVAFGQPRPYWVSSSIRNLAEPMGSFGLPSGHSQNAASVFGLLATSSAQKWLKRLLVVLIVLVAFSRLFLGVHSLQDILLGLAAGAAFLWIFLRLEGAIVRFFGSRSLSMQIVLSFVFSLLLLLLGVLVVNLFNSTPIPDLWLENTRMAHPQDAIDPYAIDGLITSTATLFGLAAGYLLILAKGGYRAEKGAFWQHALRFVIGIAGVLLIWMGLGDLFPPTTDLLGYSLCYLRYALVGGWITGLAPAVFIAAKLGYRE